MQILYHFIYKYFLTNLFSAYKRYKMENKKSLLKKVLELIEKHNITAYEIGKSCDLAVTGVQKIIDGTTKNPQRHTMRKL